MLDYAIRLNKHYSLDIRNNDGQTPAMMACKNGAMDCLNLLIENGSDLTSRDNSQKNSYVAILMGDQLELLEIFYQDMVRFEKENQEIFGMIHWAAGAQGSRCLSYLLEKSDLSELLSRTLDKREKASPLHFASIAQNEQNCKILLKHMSSKQRS